MSKFSLVDDSDSNDDLITFSPVPGKYNNNSNFSSPTIELGLSPNVLRKESEEPLTPPNSPATFNNKKAYLLDEPNPPVNALALLGKTLLHLSCSLESLAPDPYEGD